MAEPWQEPFHIPDEEIQLWRNQMASAESLILWALRNRKIDENLYLQWARDFYKIPLVQSNYFSSPLSHAAIKRELPRFCDETHVPIGQWDGQLFIGCIEPLPVSEPQISFVLAPHEPLLERWRTYFAPPSTPLAPTASMGTTLPPLTAESPHSDEPEVSSFEPEKTEHLEISDDRDLSHLFDPKTIEMDLSSIKEELEINQPDKKPEVESAQQAESSRDQIVPDEFHINESIRADFEFTTTIAPVSRESLSINQKLSSQLADIFTITSRYFEKSMIFRYSNKRFLPWKWHGPWLALADAEDHPILLTAPSLFRICYLTKLPYHGPIVTNPAHNQFFSLWDKSRIPNHVTLYPVVSERILLGAIMGVSAMNLVNNEASLKLFHDLNPTLIELFNIDVKENSAA